VTSPGIYRHHKGGLYRVLFTARQSTNGPDVGLPLVVYVSLTKGTVHVRDEQEFHEPIGGTTLGELNRFTYVGEQV